VRRGGSQGSVGHQRRVEHQQLHRGRCLDNGTSEPTPRLRPYTLLRNRPEVTSRFCHSMVSSLLHGAQPRVGHHERSYIGNRTADEAAV
jgi:hypothetical protein